MVNGETERLGRDDWIRGALDLLSSTGVEGVKIVPLAERLGVTSGSFYWHFKNRRELQDALLDYWE
jgi:AcrR family transcriptional regulator